MSCLFSGWLLSPSTPLFFSLSFLVWLFHLTLSYLAIGQSAYLLDKSDHNLHNVQKYPTAIMCFSSLILFIKLITFTESHTMNYFCISGMKFTWSWWRSLWICSLIWLVSVIALCSYEKQVYNFLC